MFYERFTALCAQRNLSVTTVLKELGLSPSKGTQWKNGTMPSSKNLAKIAEYFNVSVDYLLGQDEIKKRPTPEDVERINAYRAFSPEFNELAELYLSLSPEKQKQAEEYIRFLFQSDATKKGGQV